MSRASRRNRKHNEIFQKYVEERAKIPTPEYKYPEFDQAPKDLRRAFDAFDAMAEWLKEMDIHYDIPKLPEFSWENPLQKALPPPPPKPPNGLTPPPERNHMIHHA